MKRLILPLFLALSFSVQSQVNIDQMIEAPGGAYIIFTDDGSDYPVTGIQEYHAWKDLHLIDTLIVDGVNLCISLFMDSIPANCVELPNASGICLDTFYINAGDSLVLVECDNDTTFFAGGGGASYLNSVEGVENDGGNIDLVEGMAIDIAADDGANTITLSVDTTGADGVATPYDLTQIPISTLKSALANNTLDMGNFTQDWSSSTLAGVSMLKLGTTSTAATGGTQRILDISLTGANAGQLTHGIYVNNNHSGASAVNYGIYGQATGTLAMGVYGHSSTGTGIQGSSDTGIPIFGRTISSSINSAPVTILKLQAGAASGVSAGYGPQIDFFAINTGGGGGNRKTGSYKSLWTTTAEGSQVSKQVITGIDAAVESDLLTIKGSGLIQGNKYGTGIFGGSPVYNLLVDASGNFIEGSVPVGITDTDDQGLTIEGSGPTYDIAIDNGSDVTIQGSGITLSEPSANTLLFTAADASATNELQTLDASGTGPTITLDLSSDASDITVVGSGATAITATGNAITIGTSTEAIQDAIGPMVTGNTETGIAVTYDDAGNMFDFVVSSVLIAEEDDGVSENPVSVIDLGDGFDWNPSTLGEVDLQYDFAEFPIDAAADANEYVILWDTDGTNPERRLATSFGGGGDLDWLAVDDGLVPDNIDEDMYSGTGKHGFGTTSPDNLVELSTTASGGAFMSLQSSNASSTSVLGRIQFDHDGQSGGNAVGDTYVQRAGNTYDAHWDFYLKNSAGSATQGLELDLETNGGTAYNVDKPRLKTFGGHQNQNWVDISATTQLDETNYGVRVTNSGVTITLPLVTVTNTEGIGTELIIYNSSAGSISIDPGTGTGPGDTLNGSTTNMTLLTKEAKHFICTYIDGSNFADWISID